ncbi:hypothetical protein [Agrobacterium sp. Ap1]|nr:hypothetical protein [Agrobacterium sp. Ap1]
MKTAEIIHLELQRNMALLGVASIDAISVDHLRRKN